MIFESVGVVGAFLIRPERIEDERGFFARTYCAREFEAHGLDPRVVQRSMSYNRLAGTLRGMHYQASPHEENKQVSCSRGAVYDVIIDLRAASPTYRRWMSVTLTAEEESSLYVPSGCAHGYLTLQDDTVVRYDISEFHHPASARGLRYDDAFFGVQWPRDPIVVNARDRAYPPYTPEPG